MKNYLERAFGEKLTSFFESITFKLICGIVCFALTDTVEAG